MSNSNDIGISPVLLQAISQSLSSPSARQSPSVNTKMEGSDEAPCSSGAADQNLTERLLKQQQQPSLLETTRESNVPLQSDAIKTMLKIKMAANALTKAYASDSKVNEDRGIGLGSSSSSDIAMANVLTALAFQGSKVCVTQSTDNGSSSLLSPHNGGTQHSPAVEPNRHEFKSVRVGDKKLLIRTKPATGNTAGSVQQIIPAPVHNSVSTVPDVSENFYTTIKSEPGLENVESAQIQASESYVPVQDSNLHTNITIAPANDGLEIGKSNLQNTELYTENPVSVPQSDSVGSNVQVGSNSQLVFSFNPTPSTTEIPMDGPFKVIEHEGKRYILQTHDYDSTQAAGTKPDEPQSYTVQIGTDDGVTYTSVAEQEVVTVGQQQEEAGSITMPSVNNLTTATPCPVCGDNISGFHYGIFTCESCKGFFKRTVQNKKTFVCPRSGECEIMLENRKKCPACRFAKCLVMGMKLEAIRLDRTRGGRSSYGGSSPYEEKKKRPIKIIQRRPSSGNPNGSALVSVLNSGTMHPEKPYVPQILTDIMNLESLLCDDDIPSSISDEDLSASNPNVFLTLLQLCELKLYKIVRWARNLPYFANISTDDQILLLQNCWCELLALTLCWKSLQLTNEIIFFHGQAIDLEKACSLDLGEMFSKMLAIVEQFKRLKVDQYECVSLKVIILICPDIKGLNDAEKLSEQQQRVSMALENYTNSHYKQSPNKYGEILLRLPELSKISYLLKDHLMNWMPPNTTSCGLLYELLKGENMKDLG